MDNKSLKTSVWQRIIIIVIAILLLGSTILMYVLVVLGNNSSANNTDSSTEIAELQEKYKAKSAEVATAAKPFSEKYLDTFKTYKSQVKSYNEAAANNAVLAAEDLKEGTGKTIGEDDYDYLAYYIGWCPDGSVFDSSLNTYDAPTSLNPPMDPALGLIEGWNQGVVGMKIGGVRQLTISGDLAYGDKQKICGGYGKPLKFVIMAIEKDEEMAKLSSELNEIQLQLYMAQYYYGGQSDQQ